MAEYSSLKVPELKKLLAEKGLSQTGNKADLIARLVEDDGKGGAQPEESEAAKSAPEKQDVSKEDEITYSDDEATAANTTSNKPAAAATAPATDGAKPAEATDEAPAATDATADADKEAAEKAAAEKAASYSLGLSSTAANAEAKRRADRAKRFGIEEDEDAKKRAERAERFGLDEKDLASGLDSALPERPLKRGRGREAGENGRPGKRQSLDRRGGRRSARRGGQGGGGGGGGGAANKRGIMDDPAEKAKAEARAARFATS